MLLFVGLSHVRASLALRERCAVTLVQRERALADLHSRLDHVILLSTCGRTELYIDHPDAAGAERVAVAWLARRAGIQPEALMPYIERACGEAAVLHIVRVACGLESALKGENEILGQVRRAWLDAAASGTFSPPLDGALRLAVSTGRQARRAGGDHGWTSLAESAAAEVARTIGPLPAPRVLIAGSGPMGLHAARTLHEHFGSRLTLELAGRTPARVFEHAAQLGARPLGLSQIPEALANADAAIFGLRTSRPLLAVEDVGARPDDRPLLVVDLSVPRAVAGAVGEVPGVTLHDIDELGAESGGRGRWDAAGVAKAEQLAQRAVQEFAAGELPATATLAALRLQADGIRRAQLARTLRRLPQLNGEAVEAIDALTRAIVNRLLHEPTQRLKADQDGDLARQVGALFGVTALREHEEAIGAISTACGH